MKSLILGLLAETSIHPGAGQSAGFVDLPVAREAATDYPVIVGSSMKGALRDRARSSGKFDVNTVFGAQDSGGTLLVSDARLVLLPVRSLKSHYKWVTCPHLIERLMRDRLRVGAEPIDSCKTLPQYGYLSQNDKASLFLEERQFSFQGQLPGGLIEALRQLISHNDTATRLENQLVVISDDDFVWFARYGLSVNARNVLDPDKKTSNNLWYEETIPPDSLFYLMLAERNNNAISHVVDLFKKCPYLQVGGNETVGQGWFAVKVPDENNANGNQA